MTRLSIIVVNYKSTDFLSKCLQSIQKETSSLNYHITVVDNASNDPSLAKIERDFPGVSILRNRQNLGFSKACNQGLRLEKADYYLLVNPDCLIRERAIEKTLSFMESKPAVGIAGCRIVNSDGSFQLAAKRGIPRPATALYRLLGLSFLFPRSKTFGRYNLTFLDDRKINEVEAVSGSFLMFRHEVLETVGYLDEDFFLYGEDLDYCYRALSASWKVYYFPDAEIVHHRYQSSREDRRAVRYQFYNAMEIFYRKHFYGQASPLQNLLVLTGVRVLRRLFS
ncbi:MAG: glycosyltransferase family 2 protein [Acidobacteria bacterium]|nr:glycosyltransferase family 2 protein [Acidobacteriota bacterium]